MQLFLREDVAADFVHRQVLHLWGMEWKHLSTTYTWNTAYARKVIIIIGIRAVNRGVATPKFWESKATHRFWVNQS
jgi:hypothetical protein